MNHSITIVDCTPGRAIELKNELAVNGLVNDKDFTWRFVPIKYEGFEIAEQNHVVFEFADPVLASFYRLKWT